MNSKSPSGLELSVFQCVIRLKKKSFHFMSQSLHYKRELLLNQMAPITSVRQMKRKLNIPASISFPSLSSQLGCCQSSDWFPQGHNSDPIINNHVLWRRCQARRAAERSRTRALRFDLLLSSRSVLFFLLRWIDTRIKFDLHELISITRSYG